MFFFLENSAQNRPEASCFTQRHNAPSYNVTGKGARNRSKKLLCNVCHIGKFMKWLFKRENHVLKHGDDIIFCCFGSFYVIMY